MYADVAIWLYRGPCAFALFKLKTSIMHAHKACMNKRFVKRGIAICRHKVTSHIVCSLMAQRLKGFFLFFQHLLLKIIAIYTIVVNDFECLLKGMQTLSTSTGARNN